MTAGEQLVKNHILKKIFIKAKIITMPSHTLKRNMAVMKAERTEGLFTSQIGYQLYILHQMVFIYIQQFQRP